MKTTSGVLLSILVLVGSTFARELPLQEISNPGCKSLHWSEHSEDCKSPFVLPKETVVSGAGNSTQKLLFSVLYESSYHINDGVSGGHPGIDIVSAKGTPVVAIEDGIVLKSGKMNGYGHNIVIEHENNGNTIYSNYSHLDVRDIQAGDIVTEGQKIGEIGNTGFTIGPLGNHLDFQITTDESPTHPYAYADCDASYLDAVSEGLCKRELYIATINPFEFLHDKLDQKSQQDIITSLEEEIKEVKAAIIKSQPQEENTSTPSILDLLDLDIKNIGGSDTAIKSIDVDTTSGIPGIAKAKMITIKPKIQLEEITSKKDLPYVLKTTLSNNTLNTGRLGKLSFEATNHDGTPVIGLLSEAVKISYDQDAIKLYIDEFKFMNQGKKQLLFQTKKSGSTMITISIGDTVVERFELVVG